MSELYPEKETETETENESKSEILFEKKSDSIKQQKDLDSIKQQKDLDSIYKFNEKTKVIYDLFFTLYEKKEYNTLKQIITQKFYDELDHELLAAYIIKNEQTDIEISYKIFNEICLNVSDSFNIQSIFSNKNKLLKTNLNLIPLLHYSIKCILYTGQVLENSKIFKCLLYSLRNISVGHTEQILNIELFDVDTKPLYTFIINNCQTYSLYQTFINKLVGEMYLDKQICENEQKFEHSSNFENDINEQKFEQSSNFENAVLLQRIDDLEKELFNNCRDLTEAAKDNDNLLKDYRTVENENKTIKKVKTDLEVENIQLKNQIEELLSNEIKNTELKVKINLLEKKLELIQAEKEHHNEMNTQLKENNFEELLQIQQENEELKEENNKLKSQLEVVNRTIRHMNNVLNKKDYENEDKQREIETKQCLISEKDIIIKEKNEKIKEKEDEIKKIKLKYNKLTKINTNYINRIAKLESMIRKKKINHKLKSDEDTLYRNFMVYLRKSKYELEFIKWLESDDNQNKFIKIISEYFDDLYCFEYQKSKPNSSDINLVNNVFIDFDDLNVISSGTITNNKLENDKSENDKSENDDVVNDFISEMNKSKFDDIESNQCYDDEIQDTNVNETDSDNDYCDETQSDDKKEKSNSIHDMLKVMGF